MKRLNWGPTARGGESRVSRSPPPPKPFPTVGSAVAPWAVRAELRPCALASRPREVARDLAEGPRPPWMGGAVLPAQSCLQDEVLLGSQDPGCRQGLGSPCRGVEPEGQASA